MGTSAWQTKANATIDELIQRAVDDSEATDVPPNENGSHYAELSVSMPFASPRLLSIHAEYTQYIGQAHPFNFSTNINVEIPAGNELKFDALFDPAKASELFKYCHSELVKQSADIHGDYSDDYPIDFSEVVDTTTNLSSWKFTETGVQIDYGDYAFGGYAHCACSCMLSYAQLRSAARRDPPLP
jgi:hypothetical protein